MNAETRSSAATDTPCSLLGVACISLALVIDAANINLQVRRYGHYVVLFRTWCEPAQNQIELCMAEHVGLPSCCIHCARKAHVSRKVSCWVILLFRWLPPGALESKHGEAYEP